MKSTKLRLSLVFLSTLSLTIHSLKTAEKPILTTLSSSERSLSVSDSIDILYRQYYLSPMLYLSPAEIKFCKDTSIRELFGVPHVTIFKKDIIGYKNEALNTEDWNILSEQLLDQKLQEEVRDLCKNVEFKILFSFKEGQQLLKDAKSILKAFLPGEEFDPENQKGNYIKKHGDVLGRLYTYTKLQFIMQNQNLYHIHLPKKFLFIKNKKTRRLLTNEEASAVLDRLVQLTITTNNPRSPLPRLQITCLEDDDYDFYVYAERQTNSHLPLTLIAINELTELVKKAPFDVGFDNIFTDENGDAIIIDTEFKNDRMGETLLKLVGRYAPKESKAELLQEVKQYIRNLTQLD